MLILRRKAGEALHIGDDIRITVISVDEGGAAVGQYLPAAGK